MICRIGRLFFFLLHRLQRLVNLLSRLFTLLILDLYKFLFLCFDVSGRLKILLNCHLRRMKKVKKNQFMLELMMISQR